MEKLMKVSDLFQISFRYEIFSNEYDIIIFILFYLR